MRKLRTFRVSYQIVSRFQIDIEASTEGHAAEWAQALLDGSGRPLQGSLKDRSETRVTHAVELAYAG